MVIVSHGRISSLMPSDDTTRSQTSSDGAATSEACPTTRTVKAGEGVDAIEDSFTIDDYTRWRLLEGLDDIAITLSHADDIDAYERQRLPFKPATI